MKVPRIMGKKDASIAIRAEWLDVQKLVGPAALAVVDAQTLELDFEVVVPKEYVRDEPPEFEVRKSAELKKLRTAMESKLVETFELVMRCQAEDKAGDDGAFDEAKKALDALNSFLERSIEQIRPAARAAIGNLVGAKPDQLQTFGRIDFEKYEIRAGVFEHEVSVDTAMLDLSKAVKRKKWQECGVAWKADGCVISVKPKKEFKDAELKELRSALPEGLDRGARMVGGRFKAESATNVVFEFTTGDEVPRTRLLRQAMKAQTGSAVNVSRTFAERDKKANQDDPAKGSDAKSSSQATKKGQAKAVVTPAPTKGKKASPKETPAPKGSQSSPKVAKTSPKVPQPSPKATKKKTN
ncbi:MAG: hypothetical protein IT423_16210 [Pirellulaceae bacterium]|nr:hypothetical protein [Pirellulaceae bacterium]